MRPAPPHLAADPGGDLARQLGPVEEGHVLLPGQASHHVQPMVPGQVEEPERRWDVGAQGVDADLGHRREVAADHPGEGNGSSPRRRKVP